MGVVNRSVSAKFIAAAASVLLASSAYAQNAGGVSGFRLPPSPGSAPAQPEAQGPAEDDVPQTRPAQTPAPQTPAPATPPAVVTPPTSAQSAQGGQRAPTVPARQTPPVVVPPRPSAATADRQPVPAPVTPTAPSASAPGMPAPANDSAPISPDNTLFGPESAAPSPNTVAGNDTAVPAIATPPSSDTDSTGGFNWLLALAGIAAVLGGGLWWWRRQSSFSGPAHVPVLVRPVVPPRPQTSEASPETIKPVSKPLASAAPPGGVPASPPSSQAPQALRTAQPSPPPPPAIPAVSAAEVAATKALLEMPALAEEAQGPIRFTLEARKFSLTLMNAVLAYTVELTNTGTEPLKNLELSGDMVGGHGAASTEALFAGPETSLPPVHRIDALAPGETRELRGEFRVAFPAITPIRQGNLTATLPLARFLLEGAGEDAPARIFAIGEAGNAGEADSSASLSPFRLDQGPRIFNHLTVKRFA